MVVVVVVAPNLASRANGVAVQLAVISRLTFERAATWHAITVAHTMSTKAHRWLDGICSESEREREREREREHEDGHQRATKE